jgi:hypothetical protein
MVYRAVTICVSFSFKVRLPDRNAFPRCHGILSPSTRGKPASIRLCPITFSQDRGIVAAVSIAKSPQVSCRQPGAPSTFEGVINKNTLTVALELCSVNFSAPSVAA